MTPSQKFRERWRNHPRKAMISVHRGLWGPSPENSMSAIAGAAKIGIIEIDVQLASDGVPIVLHDDTLDRMTGTPVRVAALTSAEIAELLLREGGGGAASPLTDERVPLFADLLENAPRGAFFDFDVKHPREVEAVASFISAKGAGELGSVKIDTENTSDIQALLDLEKRHGLMVMAKVVLPRAGLDHIAELTEAGIAAAEVWFDDLNQLADACRVAGERMAISTYTLDPVHCCGLNDSLAADDPHRVWGRLLDAGVGIIMTDRPMRLDAYLDTL